MKAPNPGLGRIAVLATGSNRAPEEGAWGLFPIPRAPARAWSGSGAAVPPFGLRSRERGHRYLSPLIDSRSDTGVDNPHSCAAGLPARRGASATVGTAPRSPSGPTTPLPGTRPIPARSGAARACGGVRRGPPEQGLDRPRPCTTPIMRSWRWTASGKWPAMVTLPGPRFVEIRALRLAVRTREHAREGVLCCSHHRSPMRWRSHAPRALASKAAMSSSPGRSGTQPRIEFQLISEDMPEFFRHG